MNPGTIWAIAVKDLRQFFRDRTLLLFMSLLPVLQLLLLANTTSSGAYHLPIGVLDSDRSSESRALIALLAASETLDVVAYPATTEEGAALIEEQEIFGLVIIPEGMAVELYDPTKTAALQLIVDGTNSIVARIVQGGVQQVMGRFVELRGGKVTAGVQVRSVMLYNPSVRSRPYTIGAQLGFIVYQVTLGVAALGLAREKELGTLEQLLVTPVRRLELLAGKVVPPMLIGMLNVVIMLLVVQYVFGIPIEGSYLFLLAGSLLFIAVEVMWGTMVSSLATTQQQAILLVFIQAMVDVALSGYLVPLRDMPQLFGFLARFVPLQYYLVFVRAVILKGAGLVDMLPHLLALAGLGVVISTIATLTIGRRLE